MLRSIATVAIASTPGWMVAIATDAPLVGWALAIIGVVVALQLISDRPAHRPAAIATGETGWRVLEREVARARRYRGALTLVRVDDRGAGSAKLEDIVARCREIDTAWSDEGLWLLAVGADAAGRDPLLARLRREVPGLTADRVTALSFPEDAMTMRALVVGLTTEATRPVRLPVDALEELGFASDVRPKPLGEGPA